MIIKGMQKSLFLLAGLLLVLISTRASAQSPYQPGVGFPMVGIATGESARVNALNKGSGSPAPNTSCGVTLQFFDAQGQLLKQTVVTLQPGKAAFLDLSRDAVQAEGPRVEIRAVLLFGYFGGAPPGPGGLRGFDCNILPSLEVYDNRTGRTSFVLTDAKPMPPPVTPAQ